jgi:hypothetical protein
MSPKLKHALAASLSLALAYLFPLYFGIDDTASAAITVMVIAAGDSLGTSLQRGIYRVAGTLLGAVIGLSLLALFPQDRFLYLFVLSICVTIVLYVARAYKGDKTIFVLTAIVMMMVFDGGALRDPFIYAAERVLMTIVGIVLYTFISVYLFPHPVSKKEEEKQLFSFVWFDVEDLKGAFVTFLIFWAGALFWIYMAVPFGYLVMILATALSLHTAYSVVKPSVLIILLSISFVFATLSYIFILPHLQGWWSLGVFLFIYSFLGFYFINELISIFFLIGMATFLIENEMNFDFGIFLMTLMIMYMFLLVLLVFDYFPFNQTNEKIFVTLVHRFKKLLEYNPTSIHLHVTLKKLQFYAQKLDFAYFEVSKENIEEFLRTCEEALKEKSPKLLKNVDIELEKLQEGKF